MPIYKAICCIFFSVFTYACAYSQITISKIDSFRIEGLKKKLSGIKGKERIDCLNDIAREYLYIERTLERTPEHWHDAYYYSHLAYNEAEKIGYKYGQAVALIGIGAHASRAVESEKYFQKAIAIG